MKFCLVDISNLMYRVCYGGKGDGIDDMVGMGLNLAILSMNKAFHKFGCQHVVACFDHYSWRKAINSEYKATRGINDTPENLQIKKTIQEAIEEFRQFLQDRTNVTVLISHGCEADDFIARFIQSHGQDSHIIISTDSDYQQLVAPNVELFDGVANKLTTVDGIFYQDMTRIPKDARVIYGEKWKTKLDKAGNPIQVEPAYMLFQKIMLGDISDNISRAAPKGVGQVALRKAFGSDLAIEKIMDTFRDDLPGRPTVREIHDRNKELIDLSCQPDEIKEILDQVISSSISKDRVSRVGIELIRFCKKHGLQRIMDSVEGYSKVFSAPYQSTQEQAWSI